MSDRVLQKIVSGGQTGVDRAALDVALERGLPCGGWCPKGRRAEDGPLSGRYLLTETPAEAYVQRTEWNVRDADATLVLTRGIPTGGTAFTVECAARHHKPCLVVDVEQTGSGPDPVAWVRQYHVRVLNVAGPRESTCPGIYDEASAWLRRILLELL